MKTVAPAASNAISVSIGNRWVQLVIGIICMSMIANLQYGWTLFVNPIADKFHWAKASIQVAFTIFVLTETWLVPIEGYLVDRLGPAPVAVARSEEHTSELQSRPHIVCRLLLDK